MNNTILENYLYKQPMVERAFDEFLATKIRTDCPKVEERSSISNKDFKAEYVDNNKPVVLKNILQDTNQRNFDLEYFSSVAGDKEVFINLYDTKNTKQSNIENLIQEIGASVPSNPVYLQEWWFEKDFPEFFNDFQIPDHFDDDWGRKILGCCPQTLWIGSKGATTPIHEDTWHFNLVSLQLCGQKEWFLFDKDAILKTDNSGVPDYKSFLNNPKTQAQSCILEAGDLLYMPYKWWHRTKTLEHAASFNMPYITEEIIQKYTQAVLSMPMLMALKGEELKRLNPMRYNVTKQRVEMFADLINFNPDYVIHAIKNATEEHNADLAKSA